jgi:small subunit ribosomal protein S19e
MVTVYDVEPNKLLKNAADKLKGKVEKPAFVGIVKSGAHAVRPPAQDDFFFIRCASILRQAYINGVIGTQRLRKHYGGRKRRGVKPARHMKAGGSTIRKAIQQLEKAGYLIKEKAGRKLSPSGRKLLDLSAKESV